ncbi:hypothetical protein BpHYR1_036292 [Brachionus plicatilis]|uniref:Uncharacterized protein n=1 Tax=Brachionus plicatilis TaxID=10195 RepID=A0A3M7PZ22_BRAPC|nr:hypothetical protein BpHYR1_036292 [Brachionus plicatilis]
MEKAQQKDLHTNDHQCKASKNKLNNCQDKLYCSYQSCYSSLKSRIDLNFIFKLLKCSLELQNKFSKISLLFDIFLKIMKL